MAVYRVPVTLTWAGQGSPGVNVWSVRTVGGLTVAEDLDGALTALRDFYTTLAPHFAQGLNARGGPDITERDTQSDISRPGFSITSTAGTSSRAAPVLQGVISWRTALKARRGMGRTFVGPLTYGAVDVDGTLSAGFFTALNNAANTLVAASGVDNGWAIGIWGLAERWKDWETTPPPVDVARVHRDITAAKVQDKCAVLRSRRD